MSSCCPYLEDSLWVYTKLSASLAHTPSPLHNFLVFLFLLLEASFLSCLLYLFLIILQDAAPYLAEKLSLL
jgi:hypothetical protein